MRELGHLAAARPPPVSRRADAVGFGEEAVDMADLEFRVLGPVEVRDGGAPIPVPRGGAMSLLAGLLVSANRVVSLDRLAEMLWGDEIPRHPRPSLQTAMSRLRRVLGDDLIETVSAGYRLTVEPDRLDLLRFEALTAEATAAADDEDAVRAMERARSLWRATPLANIESAALQRDVAPWLTERYLSLCEEWADRCLRLGRHHDVARELGSLVAAHPFRERMVGQLMVALTRCGRQAEALAAYDGLRRAIGDELGVDPSPVLQDLYFTIVRGADGLGPVELPAPPLSRERRWRGRRPVPGGLIGRQEELRLVARAVKEQQAVTIVGPGGVGKTSLALEVGRQIKDAFRDGVVVVELGPLAARRTDETDAIVELACAALGIGDGPTHTRPGEETLLAELRSRELAMVFDNAEHVVAGCARLVDLILRSCSTIHVITTSRRPLGVPGEAVMELAPLTQDAAAELLLLRATEQRPAVPLNAAPADVAELYALIAGLPLAVELAAARLRTMALPDLLERLPGRPGLLTMNGRPGLPHQRGLLPTLEWSHALLTERHRLLLGRLSVFAGSFGLDDAENVCGHVPLAYADVAALLADLVDSSLVQAIREDRFRYRLLVPIREFVLARADSCDVEATRRSHLRHLVNLAGRSDETGDRLLAGFPEILAALEWSLRPESSVADAELGVRLLLESRPVWERRHGSAPAMILHTERAIHHSTILPPSLTARLRLVAGHVYYRAARFSEAVKYLRRAGAFFAEARPDDARWRAEMLSDLAKIAYGSLVPGAAELIREAADAARRCGDRQTTVRRLSGAAFMVAALGTSDEALGLIAEAGAAVAGERGLRRAHLVHRAAVHVRANRSAEALADTEEILADQETSTPYELAYTLATRGVALRDLGDLAAARTTLREALVLAEDAQTLVVLPDLHEALASVELAAGVHAEAIRHVRDVLRWTLPRRELITVVSTLHIAVVLALETQDPQAERLGAAVRDIRLRGALPTWPFTAEDYAAYEAKIGIDTRAVPTGPLMSDMVVAAAELALAHLRGSGGGQGA